MKWKTSPHLSIINQKLLDVSAGRIKRLYIGLPPRHGKSELVSRYFTAWYLGNFPDRRIILSSREAEFAAKWGRASRNVLEEYGKDLFGVQVSETSAAANRWDIRGHEGGMLTAGVGGHITGWGANLFIIDDPLKNAMEASSKVIREQVWDWYLSTAYTRLEPDASIVLVMTRWHEDDLAGRLLREVENGGEQWESVVMPAVANDNDPWGRVSGAPLWPMRFPTDSLQIIRQTLGSYLWSAMYQQNPQPEGGMIYRREWFRYFRLEGDDYILMTTEGDLRVPASKCWRFQTVDPSATEKESSDYFVIATWAVTPTSDLLLLDVLRTKAETTKHMLLMRNAQARFTPSFQAVESASYGLNIIQSCKSIGMPIKALKADTDKVSRARPMSARYEGGTVYHQMGAHWLTDYEGELLGFPNASHDDQVDTASYAALVLLENIRRDPNRLTRVRFGKGLRASTKSL